MSLIKLIASYAVAGVGEKPTPNQRFGAGSMSQYLHPYSMNQPINQISVEELAQLLSQESANQLQLVDVREPQEVEIASLEGFSILPLSQFAEWADSIPTLFDPNTETIVMCHHGIRSAQMCHWLSTQGFTNVKNLSGGIDAYSILVDSTVPRY